MYTRYIDCYCFVLSACILRLNIIILYISFCFLFLTLHIDFLDPPMLLGVYPLCFWLLTVVCPLHITCLFSPWLTHRLPSSPCTPSKVWYPHRPPARQNVIDPRPQPLFLEIYLCISPKVMLPMGYSQQVIKCNRDTKAGPYLWDALPLTADFGLRTSRWTWGIFLRLHGSLRHFQQSPFSLSLLHLRSDLHQGVIVPPVLPVFSPNKIFLHLISLIHVLATVSWKTQANPWCYMEHPRTCPLIKLCKDFLGIYI